MSVAALLLVVGLVNPFVGTEGNGNCLVGPTHPFGMVQPGPDTVLDGGSVCNGYRKSHLGIYGFSQDHLNGTGCPAGGSVRLLPFSGESAVWDMRGVKDVTSEMAEPGYYAVALTNFGVRVEITATARVAYYRFHYNQRPARLLVDLQAGLVHRPDATIHNHVTNAMSRLNADGRSLEGCNHTQAWISRTCGFAVRFNRVWTRAERLLRNPGEKADRYVLDFDLREGEPLEVRVALSNHDEIGARRNLAAEGGGSFDAVRAAACAEWERWLSRCSVSGADETSLRVFYTALYRAFQQPNEMEDDGASRFSTFSTWDTYRAAFPLYTIFAPELSGRFVASMLRSYRERGYLPVWEYVGSENFCMIGNHSVPCVVDAYLKGVDGFDRDLAFEAVTNSLTVLHPGKRKEDWPMLDEFGYYPIDRIGREPVSRLLEYCYDASCAARMSAARGLSAVAADFSRRSHLWTNNYDSAYGLVRGRDATGRWRFPFDEFRRANETNPYDCTEADAWVYTFNAQHDVERQIELAGGRDAFVAKLDRFFAHSVSAVTGELRLRVFETNEGAPPFGRYEHANEPGHHIAYLYALAGRPDRTAEVVRMICRTYYTGRADGCCGNEDCGQMSAWYVFSCLGFYPCDPCGGDYVIGAPQLPKVRLRLPKGKVLTVVARGLSEKNLFVRRVTLNDREILGPVLRHDDLMKGGLLVFEMTDSLGRDRLFEPTETSHWQAMIDAAAKRGGRVDIPPGRHPVGQLSLRSNVELHLQKDSVLEGVVGLENYQTTNLPFSERTWCAVVSAVGVTNVSVTGIGEIYGNGRAWPQPKDCRGGGELGRPCGIFFANCRNVRLGDFLLRDAASWGVVFKCCENVVARRVRIDSHANANNDGFDIEARNVLIEDCDVDSGDDAFCLKSNDPGFVMENVTVRRCVGRSNCNAFKIGTASHGSVRSVLFENCRTEAPRRDFISRVGPHRGEPWFLYNRTREWPGGPEELAGMAGIAIECVDGGEVSGITCRGFDIKGMMVPIFVRGGTRTGRSCGTPPSNRRILRDILIADVKAVAESFVASSITGVEGCRPRDVRLENVTLVCKPGKSPPAANPVPEREGNYPEGNTFGMLPTRGLYIRHADNVMLKDVRIIGAEGKDVVCDDVVGCR